MAEPTQAGAAAACPGPPHRCPHSGSCLGPLAPLQAPMAASCWLGPTGIAPPAPGASVGSPWGWECVRSWRGCRRRRGPCSAVPAMPALLPAAVFVPCLRGRRKSPQALGSALPLLRALGERSSGAQAAEHRLVLCPPALLWLPCWSAAGQSDSGACSHSGWGWAAIWQLQPPPPCPGAACPCFHPGHAVDKPLWCQHSRYPAGRSGGSREGLQAVVGAQGRGCW